METLNSWILHDDNAPLHRARFVTEFKGGYTYRRLRSLIKFSHGLKEMYKYCKPLILHE